MPALEVIAAAAEKAAAAAAEVGEKAAEATVEGAKEIAAKGMEAVEEAKDVVVEKLGDIKSLSPEQLWEQMEKNLSEVKGNLQAEADEGAAAKEGLTVEQKSAERIALSAMILIGIRMMLSDEQIKKELNKAFLPSTKTENPLNFTISGSTPTVRWRN